MRTAFYKASPRKIKNGGKKQGVKKLTYQWNQNKLRSDLLKNAKDLVKNNRAVALIVPWYEDSMTARSVAFIFILMDNK